jgi:hypothetical protein
VSLITSFEHRTDRTARFQAEHRCGWFHANMRGGDRILQLETYAKDGTTAQIMQFDRRAAGELLAIIAKVFLDSAIDPPRS